MPLDKWFPLAIYYEDLQNSALNNPALVTRIAELRAASGEQRSSNTSSWTGDIHNVDRIHFDPTFDCITEQVESCCLEYLRMLGYNLDKLDLYIQRAWPVVGTKDQRVSKHAHHTAHLSVVYYVKTPKAGNTGQTRFHNDARPNEIAPGIGSDMTGGYRELNSLNFESALYTPVEGRLIVFPSKTNHEVEPNDSDETRITLSYDLIVTGKEDKEQGFHEFLMPAPSKWKKVIQTDRPVAPAIVEASEQEVVQHASVETNSTTPEQTPLQNGIPVAQVCDISNYYQDIDSFTLVDTSGHPLWEPVCFRHISNRAAWRQYKQILEKLPGNEWSSDGSGSMKSWSGSAAWNVFKDSVDRSYCHLRNLHHPLDGAEVAEPSVQWYQAAAGRTSDRGQHTLNIYVRIDHEVDNTCSIEFDDGEVLQIGPGMMALVSGFRRHRITGTCFVISIGMDLPALARTGLLQSSTFNKPAVSDRHLFAVATAQPLHAPCPSWDLLFQKIEWQDSRKRKHNRNAECPIVNKFLVKNEDPASAKKQELERVKQYGNEMSDGALVETVPVLSPEHCMQLCQFSDDHMTSIVPDSVDDTPEYQVNISPEILTDLIGAEATQKLLALPQHLTTSETPDTALYDHVNIFIRMYSKETRPFIAFHSDTCSYTANIALNANEDFKGGNLLVMKDGRLQIAERAVGAAVLHAGNVVHGVSQMEQGTRYTLILFFHQSA